MAEDNNLNNDDKIIDKAISESQKEILNEFKKGAIDLRKAIHELTNVTKNDILGTKQRINDLKSLNEAIKQNTTIQKQALEHVKKSDNITTKAKSGDDDILTRQIITQRRFSSLQQIGEGRIASGLSNFASTFPEVAKKLNSGFVMLSITLAKLTVEMVDSWYKFKIASSRISGGVSDEMSNRYLRNMQANLILTPFNQKKEDFYKFTNANIGYEGRRNLWANENSYINYLKSWGFGRSSLEQVGANPEHADTLLQQARTVGISPNYMRNFTKNVIDATKSLDKLGSEKFISSYEELNKTLIANNINGLASARMFAKFEDQLNRGTLTVQDFTRGLTTRRGAETSSLAAVAQMLYESGLGGEELKNAVESGDMIHAAGIVRRGGEAMQRDIQTLTRTKGEEIAQTIGTSDLEEVLALTSNLPWSQMTADLKNMEVQRLVVKDISLLSTIGSTKEISKKQQEEIKDYYKQLEKEQIGLKNPYQVLMDVIKLGFSISGAAIEQGGIKAAYRDTGEIFKESRQNKIQAEVVIGNPKSTPN